MINPNYTLIASTGVNNSSLGQTTSANLTNLYKNAIEAIKKGEEYLPIALDEDAHNRLYLELKKEALEEHGEEFLRGKRFKLLYTLSLLEIRELASFSANNQEEELRKIINRQDGDDVQRWDINAKLFAY